MNGLIVLARLPFTKFEDLLYPIPSPPTVDPAWTVFRVEYPPCSCPGSRIISERSCSQLLSKQDHILLPILVRAC